MDFLEPNFSLYDVLNYRKTVNFLLGASKTGKTTFLGKLISTLPPAQKIFLLDTAGINIQNSLALTQNVKTLPIDFKLTEECLENLPPQSFLIVDDFQLQSGKFELQRVINYSAHHYDLTIFLVVHSHFFNGLYFALNNCCNLFLTYSNNSKSFLRQLFGGKFLPFFNLSWKEGIKNFHVCFINTYHSFIVNYIDCLFSTHLHQKVVIMDLSENYSEVVPITEKKWYVTDKPTCISNSDNDVASHDKKDLESFYSEELAKFFHKSRYKKMFKIVRCLLARNVISDDELILGRVNVFDFLSFTQRFGNKHSHSKSSDSESSLEKNDPSRKTILDGAASLGYSYEGSLNHLKRRKKAKFRSDKKMLRLCKKLKRKGVKIPVSLINNVQVRKIFM